MEMNDYGGVAMGYTFSNLQMRKNASDKRLADTIASMLASGRHLLPIDEKEKADIVTTIAWKEGGSWITIASDLLDCESESQHAAAKMIADNMREAVLTISCFDSDYLALNMVDPINDTDIWASSGRYPDGHAPRRNDFCAWNAYVPDVDAFRTVMRKRHTFVEECLNDIEPMLSLPASQSMSCVGVEPKDCSIMRYYYIAESTSAESQLPIMEFRNPPYYRAGIGEDILITANNQGGASRGLAVAFTGDCVDKELIYFDKLFLQTHDERGEWIFYSVDLKEQKMKNGRMMLYGEVPLIKIPEAVKPSIPWNKKMDLEFSRSISIRFVLATTDSRMNENDLVSLAVHLIPLQNWTGQCGWQGVKKPRNEND